MQAAGASLNMITIDIRSNRRLTKLHLETLESDGLVKIVIGPKGRRVYHATQDGVDWVKDYKKLAAKRRLKRAESTETHVS